MEAEDEEDKEEEEEVPMVTAPEFQPYIAQALASFQVDQALEDKGKCVHFDGVRIPPQTTNTTFDCYRGDHLSRTPKGIRVIILDASDVNFRNTMHQPTFHIDIIHCRGIQVCNESFRIV